MLDANGPLPGTFETATDALAARDLHGLVNISVFGIKGNPATHRRPETLQGFVARHDMGSEPDTAAHGSAGDVELMGFDGPAREGLTGSLLGE